MKTLFAVAMVGSLAVVGTLSAAESGSLVEPLEPFRPFLGKTWRGEFQNSAPGKRTFDTSRWERALNGNAVRVLHSVNDGAYGGESIVRWDTESKQIVYHYYTTAGFMTSGSMTVTNGRIVAVEKVSGSANGVTEVRSTTELLPDGTLLSKAVYLKNGDAAGGREIRYREDALAEVKFK